MDNLVKGGGGNSKVMEDGGQIKQIRQNSTIWYISYGNDQEHWREEFPNPETNLVANAFFFYVEPDHWFFTEGPQYLYTGIRAKKDEPTASMQ